MNLSLCAGTCRQTLLQLKNASLVIAGYAENPEPTTTPHCAMPYEMLLPQPLSAHLQNSWHIHLKRRAMLRQPTLLPPNKPPAAAALAPIAWLAPPWLLPLQLLMCLLFYA